MSEEIAAGDVVQLKSGGPKMTVQDIGVYDYADYKSAYCVWFVQDKAPWKKDEGTFPLHALKKVGND